MAPPKPPPPSHQKPSTTTSKRPHSSRRNPQQPPVPEEPPSPATSGRVDGFPPPSTRLNSSLPKSTSSSKPADPGGASEVVRAVEGTPGVPLMKGSASSAARPPLPAGKAVSSTLLQAVGTVISGDPNTNGRRGFTEEIGGFRDMLSVSAGEAMPGNAGQAKSTKILPEYAPKMLDSLPERNASARSVRNVTLEAGEVWERAPEQVVVEGSSIRAILSSSHIGSLQASPGRACTGLSSQSGHNDGHSWLSGVGATLQGPLDARMDGIGAPGSVPGPADEAGELFVACFLADLPVRSAASVQLQRGGILHSGDLDAASSALKQHNTAVCKSQGDGGEGGTLQPCFGGAKKAQFWAEIEQPGRVCPDFEQLGDATDPSSFIQRSSEQGGLVEGSKGCSAPQSNAWGRPPDPRMVGSWSPDYREAFPSLRGEGEPLSSVLQEVEGRDVCKEAEVETTKNKGILWKSSSVYFLLDTCRLLLLRGNQDDWDSSRNLLLLSIWTCGKAVTYVLLEI